MNDTSGLRIPAQPVDLGTRPAPQSVSLIDRESYFSGTYRTPHDMRIEGRYEGDIECRGTVFVGETAGINARVVAGSMIVAGNFEGDITCETRFEILPTGRVSASVSAGVTVVHEGAFYQGELRMVRPGAEQPRRLAPSLSQPAAAAPPSPSPVATGPRPGAAARPGAIAPEAPPTANPSRRRPAETTASGDAPDTPETPASLLAAAGRANSPANGRLPESAEGA